MRTTTGTNIEHSDYKSSQQVIRVQVSCQGHGLVERIPPVQSSRKKGENIPD